MPQSLLWKTLYAEITKRTNKALKQYRPNLARATGVLNPRQIPTATDASTGVVVLAPNGGTTSGTVVQADDSRLGARTYPRQLSWYEDGSVTVDTVKGPLRRIDAAVTLTGCYLSVKTAPTGAALIVDIKKASTPNGTFTSIFSSLPQISASAFAGNSTSLSTTTLNAGDYLRMDVTQVGSTVAGAGLTVDLNMTGSTT